MSAATCAGFWPAPLMTFNHRVEGHALTAISVTAETLVIGHGVEVQPFSPINVQTYWICEFKV